MKIFQFIIANLQYIVPALISCCFLVVNIIQAIRGRDTSKLKELICRIPEIIRDVETLYEKDREKVSTTTTAAISKSIYKKATAESILESVYGAAFVKKHIKVIDDAIEDILDTPQKKGGSNDGISKENEER